MTAERNPIDNYAFGFDLGHEYGQKNSLYWAGVGAGYDGVVSQEAAIQAIREGFAAGEKKRARERTRRK